MRGLSHFIIVLVVLLLSLSVFGTPARATHSSFTLGDLVYSQFRGIPGDYHPRTILWHHPDGSFNRVLSSDTDRGPFHEGRTFDAVGNFYVVTATSVPDTKYIQKYDPTGTQAGTFSIPRVCTDIDDFVFVASDANGHIWVGCQFSPYVTKLDAVGNIIAIYNIAPGREHASIFFGFDLTPEGCTIFYSGLELSDYYIGRFNTCANIPLPDLYVNPTGWGLLDPKVLPDGGVLVRVPHYPPYSGWVILRIDALGQVSRAYAGLYSHDVTPDRTAFWAQSTDYSYELKKIAIATGATLSIALPLERDWIDQLAVYNKRRATLELLDPVSDLLTGQNLSQITTDTSTLATKGTKREGVAADGVAKLVLRYPVAGPGMVQFSLVEEDGNALPNQAENGTLSNVDGTPGGGTVSVNTVTTSESEMAFAVYTAPSAFVRAGPTTAQDKQAFERGAPFVHVKPVFIPTGGTMIEEEKVRIKIKRPLVFLVHGIWSCDHTWNNFSLLNNDPAFRIQRGDYSNPTEDGAECFASRGFGVNANVMDDQLVRQIKEYRDDPAINVAVIQADIVAHSMGGLVTRMMATKNKFLRNRAFPSFGKGPVRRLITIGSPHQGTRLANFLLDNPCVQGFFRSQGRNIGNGVRDLAVDSAAIQALNQPANRTPFPIHTVVGLSGLGQRQKANLGFTFLFGATCAGLFPGVNDILQTDQHDLLVTNASQSGGRSGLFVSPFSFVSHSPPFPGPTELNHELITTRVLDILNEDPTAAFSPLP